jgi:hypothetical protein
MSLYLCVFDGDEELEGVNVGHYADFGRFRDEVAARLEGGVRGSRFPVLGLHSDCEGEWSAGECAALEVELESIALAFARLPHAGFGSEWQLGVAEELGLEPRNLGESFIDVDGEPLVERLLALCRVAREHGAPISFQ